MKISYRWLSQYVKLDLSPESLANVLTDCGLEVEAIESWESVKGGLKGVVIGEVTECIPHPGSDHLSLTKVNIGEEALLPIVCGAPNVASGQKVAVATVGTTLWLSGKELEIKKARIRGEVSEGMICAEDELGLGSSHDGIMILDPTAIPGTPAREYFNVITDTIFHIGLTPNRSDAASHIGVARDVVAVLNNAGGNLPGDDKKHRLMIPDISGFVIDNQSFPVTVVVENASACPRYSGLTIRNLEVRESPSWLKNHLLAVGLRPVNNVVDVTNFVLMETGQPLHAFDADTIAGQQVVVRNYPEGTPFLTLDGEERKLSANDLMICSETDPMCIGGVFGGVKSGVTALTKRIFLESACFDPVSIRKTARYHGLQTDASFRFERGSDIGITIYALKRAAMLLKELTGGEISSDIVDVYPHLHQPVQLTLSFAHLDRLIGQPVPPEAVRSILQDLGFVILHDSPEELTVSVPTFKVDVTREADVIEEVLRIYGYNAIGIPGEVKSSLPFVHHPDPDRIRNAYSDLLSAKGFFEILTNSLTSSVYYKENLVFPEEQCVGIVNPNSRDLDVMRQTLLYGGLETIRYNHNRKAVDLKLYETGTVYAKTTGQHPDPLQAYREEQHLGLFLSGRSFPESWNTSDAPEDVYSLKGYVQDVFDRLGVDGSAVSMDTDHSSLFADGFRFHAGGSLLAVGGLVNPIVLHNFDIKTPVLYADIFLESLFNQMHTRSIRIKELPKFPVVRRDLALLISEAITFEQIRQVARETEKRLLLDIGLFDVYEGKNIEKGKQSYAISFYLGDPSKTLMDREIDKVMEKLISAFSQTLGATLR